MKLGIDPERLGDVQELKEVEWKLIDEVKENIEVTRIIDQL